MPKQPAKLLFEKSEITSAVGFLLEPASGWTADLSKPKGVKGSDLKKADKTLYVALCKELAELDGHVNASGDSMPNLRDRLLALPPVWPSTAITMEYLRIAKDGLDHFMPGVPANAKVQAAMRSKPRQQTLKVAAAARSTVPAPVEEFTRKRRKRPADIVVSKAAASSNASLYDRVRAWVKPIGDSGLKGFEPRHMMASPAGLALWTEMIATIAIDRAVLQSHASMMEFKDRVKWAKAFTPAITEDLPVVNSDMIDRLDEVRRYVQRTQKIAATAPSVEVSATAKPMPVSRKSADQIQVALDKYMRDLAALPKVQKDRGIAGLTAIERASVQLRRNLGGTIPTPRLQQILAAMHDAAAAAKENRKLPVMQEFLSGGAARHASENLPAIKTRGPLPTAKETGMALAFQKAMKGGTATESRGKK